MDNKPRGFICFPNLNYKSSFGSFTLDKLSKDAKPKFTFYMPNGNVYSNHPKMIENGFATEIKESQFAQIKYYDELPNGDVVIIGNGGAGAAGWLKHVTKTWNDTHKDNPLVVCWCGQHSFQNFDSFEKGLHIDAAITYEPHWEAYLGKKGKLTNTEHIFNSEMALLDAFLSPFPINKIAREFGIATPDLNLEYNEQGIVMILSLICCAFIMDILDSDIYSLPRHTPYVPVESRFYKYFISRYNHSAMGEIDHYLFMKAIKRLITYLKDKTKFTKLVNICLLNINNKINTDISHSDDQPYLERWFPFGKEIPVYIHRFDPSSPENIVEVFNQFYQLDGLFDNQIEIILYKEWMNHVERKVVQFPWDILASLKENPNISGTDRQEYDLTYSTNDIAFIFKDDYFIRKVLFMPNRDPNSDGSRPVNDFNNPAQLSTSPYIDLDENRTRSLFLKSLVDPSYNHTYLNWFPTLELRGKVNTYLSNTVYSSFDGLYEIPHLRFNGILREYMERVKIIESNTHLNNTWIWHQPAQTPVILFSDEGLI